MEITGTLVYDPVALATGRDRTRIIRRHIQELHVLTRAYTPYLKGRLRRTANKYDRFLQEDPFYWIRNHPVAPAGQIEAFYHFAKSVSELQDVPVLHDFTKLLRRTVKRVEDDLVLTRKNQNWAILRVDYENVRTFFKQIRADGTKISASVWGPHVSVIRGERRPDRKNWYVGDGQEFTVEVEETISCNRRGYFWLHAKSLLLEEVRTLMGLPPRPSPPFHLTIGKR